MRGLKLPYYGLEKEEQWHLEKEPVAEKSPPDGKGRGSYLEMRLAVARASGTTRADQVCSRSPWLEGLEVDAWDTVLWRALLYLCS